MLSSIFLYARFDSYDLWSLKCVYMHSRSHDYYEMKLEQSSKKNSTFRLIISFFRCFYFAIKTSMSIGKNAKPRIDSNAGMINLFGLGIQSKKLGYTMGVELINPINRGVKFILMSFFLNSISKMQNFFMTLHIL